MNKRKSYSKVMEIKCLEEGIFYISEYSSSYLKMVALALQILLHMMLQQNKLPLEVYILTS